MSENFYYVGQRVIVYKREIGIVQYTGLDQPFDITVETREGSKSYAFHNVEPLPNGQL